MRKFEDSVRELRHVSETAYRHTKDPWWKERVEWCRKTLKSERLKKEVDES